MTSILNRSLNPIKISLLSLSILILYSCTLKKKDINQSSSNLRIITYNVWYGFTQVPDRKQLWKRWMQEQNPDVVSLQELNEYTPEKLADDAKSWDHPFAVLLKEEGFPTGITSRYPIEDVQRYLEGFHHGLLRVKIKDIYFYVIHLHPSNWETRGREMDLILENINGLPEGAAVIIAGDFNTFSSKDSIYYTHGKLEPFFKDRDDQFNEKNLKDGKLDYSVIGKLMDNGFVDVEYHLRPEDYKFTGSFPTLVEKEGEDGDQRRLDYVFVSKNLVNRVIDAKIMANDTTRILSDHLPVRIDFQLE